MKAQRRTNPGAGAVATLVAALALGVVACGGLTSIDLYRPVGPAPVAGAPPLGENGDFGWTLETGSVRVFVSTVILSEKLTWVFGPLIAFPTFWEDAVPREGPLRVEISVTAAEGAQVLFDTGAFMVEFEDGRSLVPVRFAPTRDGEGEPMPSEPVMLSDGGSWRGFLEFEVALADLPPFTLSLPPLTVNGSGLDLPPVPFERGTTRGSA